MNTPILRVKRYTWAVTLTVIAVGCLVWAQPHANLTSASLVLVLVVTVTAIAWGSGPALVTALLSMFSFNYFFIPPIYTFRIAEPQNWIAFLVFVGTAGAVGQLSSRARNRAHEAEARRIEIEHLYRQLTEAFDKASEAETLRRSEQLKTALLDSVTHDLRTPLTSIKASVTTLIAGTGNMAGADSSLSFEERCELLDVINEESDRLNHFVEEMMTLAQLEGGQFLLRRSETPTLDIINAAADRAAIPLREHSVNINVGSKVPLLIVDGACMSGVIYELLVNAAKYSASGSVIRVNVRQISANEAEITVENEGVTLPPDIRKRVFEKFYRGPNQQRENQGFGLGLSIARGIVEAHGGVIGMDAGRNGTGNAVRFTVPCITGSDSANKEDKT
ncbi:MAG: sensor histidine kinase [Terriglobales bacterium]